MCISVSAIPFLSRFFPLRLQQPWLEASFFWLSVCLLSHVNFLYIAVLQQMLFLETVHIVYAYAIFSNLQRKHLATMVRKKYL